VDQDIGGGTKTKSLIRLRKEQILYLLDLPTQVKNPIDRTVKITALPTLVETSCLDKRFPNTDPAKIAPQTKYFAIFYAGC